MNADDRSLLREYAERHSQDAFATLVNKHLNLVYSVAMRVVRSPQLAEEVAQSVFTDLARYAGRLRPDTILTAWLYRVAGRTAVDIVRRESRRQHREQQAVEIAAMNSSDWKQIEPLLDEAMQNLDETDRDAVLLRYFENQSLREVGQMLGVSDDAAQKRVSRAVERLREFFGKRGVAIGAGALVAVISANAVAVAPAGLAAAVAPGTAAQLATATVTNVIDMTTLQKIVVTATVAVVAGAGIYEARQASTLRSEVESLQQQQSPLTEQIRQLKRERDDATNQLAGLLAENEQLKSNSGESELLRLRNEVAMLRQQKDELWKMAQPAQNTGKENSSAIQTNFIPRESWGFAGFATPDATVKSMVWAKSVGDVQSFLACFDAQQTNAVLQSYLKQDSIEERSKLLADQSQNWSGLQIVKQVPLADDEVLIQERIQVETEAGPQLVDLMMVLRKIEGEWKYIREYPAKRPSN